MSLVWINVLIMDWAAIGVIITGVAVVISFGVFVWESKQRRRAAAESARRELVGRAIDAVERAARDHARFPFGRVSSNPEFELAIALPRILVDLDKADAPVGMWVASQLQVMQSNQKPSQSIAVLVSVSMSLASWHRGDRATAWFESALKDRPLEGNFRMSRKVRFSRELRRSWEVAKLAGSGFITVIVFRNAYRAWVARS